MLADATIALLQAQTHTDMLSKALPAARNACAEAESNYELAVAAKKATEDTAAQRLEAALSGEVASVAPALDLAAKRRSVEAAEDALAMARLAKQRLLDREDGIRRELDLAKTVHRNAALRVLSAEIGGPLVARAQHLMAETGAVLSA